MTQMMNKSKRAKSAVTRNYTNVELHACLD